MSLLMKGSLGLAVIRFLSMITSYRDLTSLKTDSSEYGLSTLTLTLVYYSIFQDIPSLTLGKPYLKE